MPDPIRIFDKEGDLLLLRTESDGDMTLVAVQEADLAIVRFGKIEAEQLAAWLKQYLEAGKQ